jgi:anti-sigma factor RsiW
MRRGPWPGGPGRRVCRRIAPHASFNFMEADSVDCNATARLLSAYLDGEVPQGDAAAVEGHLRGCARCAAELAELRALSHLLNGLEGLAVPSDFAGRTREAAANALADSGRREPVVLFGLDRARPLGRVLMRVAAGLVAVAGLWMGMSVGGAAFAGRDQTPAESDVAEQSEFDLQMESLSAAPPGSMAEAYLAFVSYEEGGGQEP